MASEVERLKKELATLEAKRAELQKKQTATRQQLADVKNRRGEVLIGAAEGDEAAKREKRGLDQQHSNLTGDDEIILNAMAELGEKIDSVSHELARNERSAAIAALEAEIAGLSKLDGQVTLAIGQLRNATDSLFSSVDAVASELRKLDGSRWNGGFASGLRSAISDGLLRVLVNLNKPHAKAGEEGNSFVDVVRPKLRAACAQLAYENCEGHIVPSRGEKLYRANGRISGLRDLDLPHGSLIALQPSEAAEFVRSGALKEETAPAA